MKNLKIISRILLIIFIISCIIPIYININNMNYYRSSILSLLLLICLFYRLFFLLFNIISIIILIIKKHKFIDIKRHIINIVIYFIGGFLVTLSSITMNTIAKPIIYIYPTEDNTEVTLKLSNPEFLTSTYPKYENEWKVLVNKDGNIYDTKTNRNYYGLYWEGNDTSKTDMSEGFVVKGSDTVKFLEDKLSYLGLNEREINEFIVYWLPKMENNKYNYIRFRTLDEINKYMDISTNCNIDTEIRVIMDFKGLNKKINVREQHLTKVERHGFTLVEWGGRELN